MNLYNQLREEGREEETTSQVESQLCLQDLDNPESSIFGSQNNSAFLGSALTEKSFYKSQLLP